MLYNNTNKNMKERKFIMNDLEKRVIELENKVTFLEGNYEKFKNETTEVMINKLSELNTQLQQFQKDTINACIDNVLKAIKE